MKVRFVALFQVFRFIVDPFTLPGSFRSPETKINCSFIQGIFNRNTVTIVCHVNQDQGTRICNATLISHLSTQNAILFLKKTFSLHFKIPPNTLHSTLYDVLHKTTTN